MAPVPLSEDWATANSVKGPVSSFEILPDDDVVVLRGSGDEAAEQLLSGRIVLNLKSSINAKVRLRLSRRIHHMDRLSVPGDPLGSTAVNIILSNEDIHSEYLVPEHQKLASGEHSWSFCIPIKPDTPASLEGPPRTYLIYRLRCDLERGMMARDIQQKKHIRIHRTFSPASLTLQTNMVTDSVWEGKCQYNICVPTKGIIYGTHIPIEFKLAPLAKGVKPLRTKCYILQTIRVRRGQYHKLLHKLADLEYQLDEHVQQVPESLEPDVESYYNWTHTVPVPRNLTRCCQSWKESAIPDLEVKHFLSYRVAISNLDGHVSEIQGKLPIHLFFTQAMHVEGNSVTGLPESSSNPMEQAIEADVPPDYAHSHLDALYEHIPTSGYATPQIHSGAITPRNASVTMDPLAEAEEDVDFEAHANALRNQLNDEINPISTSSSPINEPNANALRNRLEQINRATGCESHGSNPRRSVHGSLGHSPLSNMSMTPAHESSNPLERPHAGTLGSHAPVMALEPPFQSAGGSGSATPHGLRSAFPTRPSSPVHLEDLSRVPSYNTAVATPAPSGNLGSQHGGPGLPTYMDVEQESASRNGSINGSTGSSYPHTPGTVTPGTSIAGEAASSSSSPRAGFLSENSRSKSGIFGSLLHKHR